MKSLTTRNLLLAAATLAAPVFASAAIVTFESPTYTSGASMGALNGGTTNAPFTGVDNWSLSMSTDTGRIQTTTSSGEYVGGQALAVSAGGNTYIGGKLGIVSVTGVNSITFDAFSGASVTTAMAGFLSDPNSNGKFDQTADAGMQFGFNTGAVVYRNAGFSGTSTTILGGVVSASNWYRFTITLGDSVAGSRGFTVGVRNLTTATDVDLNGASAGTLFSGSVTDAAFGGAPEAAVGGFVRLTGDTGGIAQIDNLSFTAVPVPEPSTYGLIGAGALAGVALVRRRRKLAGKAA